MIISFIIVRTHLRMSYHVYFINLAVYI